MNTQITWQRAQYQRFGKQERPLLTQTCSSYWPLGSIRASGQSGTFVCCLRNLFGFVTSTLPGPSRNGQRSAGDGGGPTPLVSEPITPQVFRQSRRKRCSSLVNNRWFAYSSCLLIFKISCDDAQTQILDGLSHLITPLNASEEVLSRLTTRDTLTPSW